MMKNSTCIDHGVNMQLYVEMDPSERYGRFKDVLGKGAMKTVYRAFDEFLGREVAWNQVKLDNIFKSPEDLQRLYSEVLLLKNLNHDSIMRFRTSWIDTQRRTFNFITEMFTSGNLREYRKKYKRVNIRAVKDWARQILEGLHYLHAHDPPVIHRDLKCDNIFVNGHLGQVKIGDLGLAAILRGSQHAHSVIGTPEFMAPELYEEEYDELVDIYSFGMCVLEMLTSEYPYNECSNPAQIYKKVTSGKLPESFNRIEDAEARRFVGRCLGKASIRPSARELLMDTFFSIDQDQLPTTNISSCKAALLISGKLEEFLPVPLDVSERSTDMIITGTMNADDDAIFLKVQISDKNGQARNIYFPFEITSDTPLDVATEMVRELEITEWEPDEIADMIDGEITRLVPSWKDSTSVQIHEQQSFNYEDDNDDNIPRHPFYSTSSLSSSQASLPICLFDDRPNYYALDPDLLQEEANAHDDAVASSQSSSCSSNYHNHKYFSANEDDFISTTPHKEEVNCISKTQKFTRFGPGEGGGIARNCSNILNVVDCNSKKMVRSGSLVDIRSQLLHHTLVDEINKRRLFKTIGAVEQIGYHDPGKSMGGEKYWDKRDSKMRFS